MRKNRTATIIAQDPGVRVRGRILTARISVPDDHPSPGPRGHRAHVIDYDSTTHTLYAPRPVTDDDPFASASNRELLTNPHFHAENVFAIVMRTIARFEHALGRRAAWSFGGHQIKIAPHAFADANAFYSKEKEALLFGYFPASRGRTQIFTCLSHDIVVHETTHALLDGIRPRYTDPSGPDQAAFHEGFADLVALLSVFSLPEIVEVALDRRPVKGRWPLRESLLLRVAKEVGMEVVNRPRRSALRRPADLCPSKFLLHKPEFIHPHRRGEVLVAAMLHAFLDVWHRRIRFWNAASDRTRVVEEGASIASHLLTVAIRALDYAPPVDIHFSDYLSALLTADFESSPDDGHLGFRRALRVSFDNFGISPASFQRSNEYGLWELQPDTLDYSQSHFESMQRDPEEVFRFLWQNRASLGLSEEAYLQVESVRPCIRSGPDGFTRRETVSEYTEVLQVRAGELAWMSPAIAKPTDMEDSQPITLCGGGALVFDEHGKLKYHIRSSLRNAPRQTAKLQHLWKTGQFES